MKTHRTLPNAISWLLVIVMVVQSCTVYKSTPITLEQAVQNESKVKIVTNRNQTFIYKKIVFDEGKYYGVERVKSKKISIPINEDLVKSIQMKNQVLSALISVATPIVIIIGIGVINTAGGGLY